ncbi:MAG: hydroxymethylbilane synthase [Selenomonadaceae bacterium]|nr:hydroxymethylbilane synthase [Selenomonadaceae bacterium]
MEKNTVIIGTRGSKLALWQADFVAEKLKAEYPGLTVTKKLITTKGDKILDTPLAKIGGKGLFTKELESAMLAGEIDIAVHSLKDMPTLLPEGLTIGAITQRNEGLDALVSPKYQTLNNLPVGAKVGTSSLRRRAQLLHLRPDLAIISLRGNVNTRLAKLAQGDFDAIVLAAVGLKRLGLANCITEMLSPQVMLPAVGQGALAIEVRADDAAMLKKVAFLNDEATALCAAAERGFLGKVGGGCQVPVGVRGEIAGTELIVEAVIASLDGQKIYRESKRGQPEEAKLLGEELADLLLEAGGSEILRELGVEV